MDDGKGIGYTVLFLGGCSNLNITDMRQLSVYRKIEVQKDVRCVYETFKNAAVTERFPHWGMYWNVVWSSTWDEQGNNGEVFPVMLDYGSRIPYLFEVARQNNATVIEERRQFAESPEIADQLMSLSYDKCMPNDIVKP